MSEDEKEQESQHDGLTENHFDSERDATVNRSDKTLNHSDSDDDGGFGRGRTQAPTGYDVGGPIKVGVLILGRYEVLSELDRGGMGVVYRCFDKIGGTEVAVKSLPPEVSHSEYDMEDVKDNYALVSKLVHQNIATYKTLEKDDDGDYYVVMEYVQGEELRRWMRRKRREGELTLETVLPILRQVAEALDFAHHKKVIHRDVKPANVMVESDGTVKILDFGLAAQIRTSFSHVSNAVTGKSGTRQYMSPEQWRGQPQGAAADQYALAAMAYEMLGGRVPFDNEDPGVLREIVLKEQPPSLEEMSKGVNEALARGLAKDAKQRFASCLEFVSALEKAGTARVTQIAQTAGKKEPVSNIPPVVTPQPPPVQPPKVQPIASPTVEPSEMQDVAAPQNVGQTQQAGDMWERRGCLVSCWRGVKWILWKAIWPLRFSWRHWKISLTVLVALLLLGVIIRFATSLPEVPELVKVEAGSFMMGSPENEEGRRSYETQHRVTLTKDFWIGKYEVTQKQYKAIMGENPSYFWFHVRGDYPVEEVSWDDAMEYCRKLTERERRAGRLQEGYEYSLPTEAQWEYAARGGNKSKGYKYSGSDYLDEVRWYDWRGGRGTHPVGEKKSNELGIYDMSGNVWEWCRDSCEWKDGVVTDTYGVVTDTYGVVTDTYKDGMVDPWNRSGSWRVIRGGGWCDRAEYCRSVGRFSVAPSARGSILGFRLALVPVQ